MNVINNKGQTDEETYRMLKRNKNEDFMIANEWKKLRLKQLKKEGKVWSK